MLLRTLLSIALLSLCFAAHAQVAADDTLRLDATSASPWGSPLSPAMAKGTLMRLAPGTMEGPAPLRCANAVHEFVRVPAEGLFEGNLPAPAQRSAEAMGLPERLVTQRVACNNGSFDIHRAADGRAWIGLDNAVLRWERASIAASPEATVQLFLIAHFAGGMALSRESIDVQRARLTDALVAKFTRWFARTASSDEVPDLNGDPFTDSQESPESFELARATVRGERAEIMVTYRDAADARYPVRFQLARVKGAWRIDEVGYRDGQLLSQLLAR